MNTYNCELSVHNDKEVSYADDMGRTAKGKVRLNDLTKNTINRVQRWVKDKDLQRYCERDDFVLLGRHLYEVLFDEGESDDDQSVRKAFEDTYHFFDEKMPDKSNQRLRVVLAFHEDAEELAKLPWEFIYIPIPDTPSGFFLAGQKTELILTRYVPRVREEGKKETYTFRDVIKQQDKLGEVKQLRIFLLYCQPKGKGYDKVEGEKVITKIRGLGKDADKIPMEKLEKEEGTIIRYREHLTYDDLKKELDDFKPHIFHFIGHGKPGHLFLIKSGDAIKSEAARLDIATEKVDQGEPRDSNDVGLLFTGDKPRLVFLESCSSAENIESSLEGLSSVARHLVRVGIPSVVAMQYPIENDDVSLFASTFYQGLGKGMNIDEAVNVARKDLGEMDINPTWSKRRFGTPVIYLQTEQRIVQPKTETGETEAEKKMVPCPCGLLPIVHYVLPTAAKCDRSKALLKRCPKGHFMVKGYSCPEPECEYIDEAEPLRELVKPASAQPLTDSFNAGKK